MSSLARLCRAGLRSSLNVGVKDAVSDTRVLQKVAQKIEAIAGQKAVQTKAKKSIAGFKIREGDVVGLKVTLRGRRMEDFLKRLVEVTIPRVRDFHGISPKQIDEGGNLTIGIKEHIVFPEIEYDKVDVVRGMDIIVCTTANSDDEARALLKEFNFPFRK